MLDGLISTAPFISLEQHQLLDLLLACLLKAAEHGQHAALSASSQEPAAMAAEAALLKRRIVSTLQHAMME